MPISRMQQPRQMYGLGSLVKSVTKGVKSAVSGAADAVKSVAKSDIGKLALMYGATAGLGSLGAGKGFGSLLKLGTYAPSTVMSNLGASLFGSGALADYGTGSKGLLGTLGITPGFGIKEFAGKMGMAKAGLGLAGLTTFMSQQGMTDEQIAEVQQNPEALKVYLRQYYSALNPKAESKDVEKFVEMNTAEYRADGGRIGFQQGGNFDFNQFLQDRTKEAMQVQGIGQAIRPVVESNVRAQAARDLSQAARGGGIESFLRGKLGSGIIPGMSSMQSPMTGTSKFGRQQVIDALTKSYMNQYNTSYTPASNSSAPPSKTPLELKMEANKKIYDEYMLKNSPIPTPGVSASPPPIFYEDQSLINKLTALSPEEAFGGETFETLSDPDQYSFAQAFPQFQSQLRNPNYVSSYGPDPISAFSRRYGIGLKEGGRIRYAYGNRAEDNAIQASGVEGLPLNQNPAGITELDLRDSGGFIPPVGVKERADDIPAMLSNNEFVFTADAVRGMGDGDVNKGAQRMYDMMKKLENGGRV